MSIRNMQTHKKIIRTSSSPTVLRKKGPAAGLLYLLNETGEKEKYNLVKTMYLKNTIVDSAVIYFIDPLSSLAQDYVIRFIINGEENIIKGKIEDAMFLRTSVRETICKHVAAAILKHLMSQIK